MVQWLEYSMSYTLSFDNLSDLLQLSGQLYYFNEVQKSSSLTLLNIIWTINIFFLQKIFFSQPLP